MQISGRPPINPQERKGNPVRALVTYRVLNAIEQLQADNDLNQSEVVRLGLYHLLEKYGLLTDEMRQDETWSVLREKGIL